MTAQMKRQRHAARVLVSMIAMSVLLLVMVGGAVRAAPVVLTSTADFDAGVKSAPSPADGNLQIETNTDNPAIASGDLAMANIGGDRFDTAVAATTSITPGGWTYKWYRDLVNSSDQNGAQHMDISTTVAGQLYMRTVVLNSAASDYGVVSNFSYSGDFNFTIHATHIDSGDQGVRLWFGVYNEKHLAHTSTVTIDGVQWADTYTTLSTIQAYTITNGVQTTSGSAATRSAHDYYLRLTRAANSIGFWDSADGTTWTRQSNPTFSFTGDVYVGLAVSANTGGRQTIFSVDDVSSSATTIGSGGYRVAGTWTSALQTYAGQAPYEIVLSYDGATPAEAIDYVQILGSTGTILYVNNTDVTTGGSHTYAIPIQANLSQNWKAKLGLKGDGDGTPTIHSVTVDLNAPPVSHFTYGFAGPNVGVSTVLFNGTNATDSDGTIVNWTWSFGDGFTGYGRLASHKYTFQGTYTVRLTVRDNIGATASTTQSVKITQGQAIGGVIIDQTQFLTFALGAVLVISIIAFALVFVSTRVGGMTERIQRPPGRQGGQE